MSEINILPAILTRIGLNENDIKVYSSTLGLGRVTIGELMVVTRLDPLNLVQTVKNLEELGLLKKIDGLTPQYMALLPFLNEYITIERDSLYAIDGLLNSLKADAEQYKEKKKEFGGKLDKSNKNHMFDIHIVSGLIKQLSDSIYSQYTEDVSTLSEEITGFIDSTKSLINKDIEDAKQQSLAIALHLDTYIQELSAFLNQFKHTASTKSKSETEKTEKELNDLFNNLRSIIENSLSSHSENHKEFLDKLSPELDGVLNEYIKKVSEIQSDYIEEYNKIWDTSFESWTHETNQLTDKLAQTLNSVLTEQIKQTHEVRRAVENIDRNINNLSSILVDVVHMVDDIKKKKRDPILAKLNEVRDGIRELANDLSQSGLQIIDKYTIGLNDTKDKIREELDHFQLDSVTNIKTKKSQIISQVTEKMDLLPTELLDSIQTKTESYAEQSYNSCKEVTSNLVETVKKQLDEAAHNALDNLKVCYDSHLNIINDLGKQITTEVSKTKNDVEKIGNGFKDKLNTIQKTIDSDVVKQKNSMESIFEKSKKDMLKKTDETKKEVTTKIIEAEEMQIDAVIAQVAAVIKDVDDAITNHLSLLQEKAMAYYHVINTREDELKQIYKAASSVKIEGQHNVSIVVGDQAIIASLTDLAMRAKRELLIITPSVEETILQEMSHFTKANRITLVSDFSSGKYNRLIRNLKEQFIGLKLRQYDKRDVYCAIKDGFDEAVFAFLTPDSTPVAIRTDNELLLQLFKAAVNRDVLFHTHDYEI